MVYHTKGRQVSYGEAIGILLLENYAPFIPGDTANATTYRYPVRFQRVPGLSVKRIFEHDASMYEAVRNAAELVRLEGVRAITGDCGFMSVFQQRLADEMGIPVFLSSLLQLPFMSLILGPDRTIGVITANNDALTEDVFTWAGVPPEVNKRVRTRGLEDDRHFVEAVFEEQGMLDSEKIETAVVQRALGLCSENPDMGAILLECSMLPPYAAAVQEATGLPVFDYISMIDYVHSTVVKQRYRGSM